MIEVAWDRREKLIAVLEYMRKHGLTIADLIKYGGEDLRDPARAPKARQVEKTWELISGAGADYAKLEDFVGIPVISAKFPRQTLNRGITNS